MPKVAAQKKKEIWGRLLNADGKSINGGRITLHTISDTIQVISDSNGVFGFKHNLDSTSGLWITALGYESLSYPLKLTKDTFFVTLTPEIKNLKEVVISARRTLVTSSLDTIEYKVSNYKLREGESLADLLTRLPGAHLDNDGNIIMMGEKINGIMINGQRFMLDNIKLLIDNLPVDVINKIQLINDYGIAGALNNRKTGTPNHILNLQTNQDLERIYFLQLSAGVGSQKRYFTSLNGNYFTRNHQFFTSISNNNTYIPTYDGTYTNIGTTYRYNKNNKLQLGLGFQNTQESYNKQSTSSTKMLTSEGVLNSSIVNKTYNNHNDSHFKFEGTFSPDSIRKIIFSIKQDNHGYIKNDINDNSQTGIQRIDQKSQGIELDKGKIIVGNLGGVFKFNKPRRILSFNLDVNFGLDLNNKDLKNSYKFLQNDSSFVKDSLDHRLINIHRNDNIYNFWISYIEPISASIDFELKYAYSYNTINNIQATHFVNSAGDIYTIDSLSNHYNINNQFHLGEVNFQIDNKKGLQCTFGFSFKPYQIESRKKTFGISLFPVFNITRKFRNSLVITMNYSGAVIFPSYEQLQQIPDTRDPLFPIIGNPYLHAETNHLINFDFKKTSNSIYYFSFSGKISRNKIVRNLISVEENFDSYKQETHFVNTNGPFSINAKYGWTMPVGKKKNFLTFESNTIFNNEIYFLDNQRKISKNFNFSVSAHVSNYLNETEFGHDFSYQLTKNIYDLSSNYYTTIQAWNLHEFCNLYLTKTSSIVVTLNKQFNIGLNSDVTANPFILDAEFKKSWFGNRLIGRFEAHNILDENKAVFRSINSNTETITREVNLGRYFMFTMIYQIRNANTKE